MTKQLKRPEVLSPAGTLEKLKVAVRYGADAVFIGGQAYGLRSRAAVSYTHLTLPTNREV